MNPDDLPILGKEELQRLQLKFPPRCLGPRETVEDHLRYAGKVDLVEALVARREDFLRAKEDDGDMTIENIGSDGEDLVDLSEGEHAASA